MFEFNYCDKPIMNNAALDNKDETIIDDDAMMITIGVQNPDRERKISSECDDMLRDLYDDIQEITVNCSGSTGNMMTNSFSDDNYPRDELESYYDYNELTNIESLKSAMISDYEWNYTMPILTHICGFYGLKKRGTKAEIVKSIVEFELMFENAEIVEGRKKIFEFMRLIKENDYMKRFILFP
jgi:hypothetical protein